jgi:competence protein ComEC
MKRPLTGLVVLYAVGIWLGSIVNLTWPMLGAMAGVLLVVSLCLQRSRYSLAPLLLAVVCAGMFAYRFSTANRSPMDIANLADHRDQNVSLRGVIVSDPGYREAEGADAEPTGDRHSFRLDVEAVNGAPATGRVLVFISSTREQSPLHYGDRIDCTAILRVPPPSRNPGTFDWQRWLARQRIQFTATVRKTDTCTVLAVGQANPVMALSQRVRERFEKALQAGLEKEPALAGVLAGMVIGERSEIPSDAYEDFQNTGVFHVFAISGLHVGIVTVVVVIALRLLRVPRRWCGLVAIPLLVLYVFATGARPGAVRALVMAGVWLIGWMLVRPADGLSNLAAAALAILLWQPAQLFDGGFILSFSVVLALLTITPRILDALKRWIARDEFVPGELTPRWRLWLERPAMWFVQLLACSLAAWIGLLPLMAVYFHLFTPIGILANVLVVPMLGFIISLGLASAAVYGAWPWLAATFNNANFFLLGVMMHGVEWLARLPGGHQFVQAPPSWWVAAYYVLLALLLSRLPRLFKRVAVSVAAIVVGAGVVFIGWPKDVVEITALDLPDGMAVFVNAPGERHDWLIDGGGDWSGERVVVPYLRGQGVDRLESIVLTRGDKAHAGGLNSVVQRIPTGQALHGGTGSRSKFFWDWLGQMRQQRLPLATLREGDERTITGDLRLRVFNPPRDSSYTRSDDNAVMLLLEFGASRILLTSDTGARVERRLLQNHTDVRAQVIVKGRHSNEISCTDEFLDVVRPEAVVQCVNPRPTDRYIQPELRDRLRQRGITYYRTDDSGAVTIHLARDGYAIYTWR